MLIKCIFNYFNYYNNFNNMNNNNQLFHSYKIANITSVIKNQNKTEKNRFVVLIFIINCTLIIRFYILCNLYNNIILNMAY